MKNPPSPNTKWFNGIDSLRFVLALIVLLSHFDDPLIKVLTSSSLKLTRTFGSFLANAFDGTAAVIAFFIISGFVIHYPNKDGIKDLKTFWIRRFARILIPLVVIYIAGVKYHHPDKSVIWSLICELFYYAIYPFLAKIKINWFRKFTIAYFIAIIFICAGAYHDILSLFKQTDIKYHSYYWQFGIFFTWIVGLPVWLLGVMLAENIDNFKKISFNKIVVYRCVIFFLSCFFTFARSYLYLSYILSMNLFALLIYKWIEAEIIYFKNNQPIVLLEKLGKFSYSLYLCHPIIYLVLSFWLANSVVTYPILIISTIFISYFFYLVIERPSHLLAVRLSSYRRSFKKPHKKTKHQIISP